MKYKQIPKILLALQIILCMGSLQAWATAVTASQAEKTARKFLASRHRPLGLAAAVANTPASARGTTPQEPLLHVFNIGRGEGFIIVSGDDATTTDILAYSDHGTFCYDSLPPNARAWIDGYAEQIADLRQCGAPKAVRRQAAAYPAIQPLLTCEWGQDVPYNNRCPSFWGDPSVTGCVATAMAQVLYYHYSSSKNTVSALQDDIPNYECERSWSGLGRIKVDGFPKGSPIDWVHMKEKYDKSSTEVERQAVASLMAYCGASVETDYANDFNRGSSASLALVPAASKKYFGYALNSEVKFKKHFSEDNWGKLIYRELWHKRPVILSGNGSKGHVFVCDGYDGEGFFHINWGWEGSGDAFYSLNNLHPSVKDYSYNYDVYAIVGFQPGDGTPYIKPINLTIIDFGKESDNTYSYVLQNRTTGTYYIDFRTVLCQGDVRIKVLQNVSLKGTPFKRGLDTEPVKIDLNDKIRNVSPGDYQVKVECCERNENKWKLVEDADVWYIDVHVASNGEVTSGVHPYDDTIDLSPELLANIATPRVETQEAVYTLTGRKVAGSAEAANRLPAGIYVSGGRKIIVK